MSADTTTLMAVGDIILGMPEPESYFNYTAPVLKSGDFVIGNGETPYTLSRFLTGTPLPMILVPPPDNMLGLTYAGFNVITFASNLTWKAGAPGVEDTLAWLREYGIATAGAGMNIKEARQPALIERKGTRVGVLAYNCVGPREGWATQEKAGCAYVHFLTHYEPQFLDIFSPTLYTFPERNSLQAMIEDIRKLRSDCDVLVVSFHKGMTHIPVKLLEYETQISHAAIDAGADLVLGHHAHICKGIEIYQGKPIFHGLGNFLTVFPPLQLEPGQKDPWAVIRTTFELDPEYPTYPFHPDSRQTIIAKCVIENGRIARTSFIPCLINRKGQPEVLKNDERGQQVFEYMEKITREAELNARYEWDGDEVVVR